MQASNRQVLHLLPHRDEHLPAVELNLVSIEFEIILHLREVQHTGQVKGIVYVEVNPKERIFGEGVGSL